LTAGASAAGSIEELHEYRRRIIHALKARASAAGPAEVNHPGPAVLEPFAVFSDIDALWCPEMVALPSGEFLMGSPNSDKDADDCEKPRHCVTIGYRFAIGRYPVTFDEYDHFCRATRRKKPSDEGWGRQRRPVISSLEGRAGVRGMAGQGDRQALPFTERGGMGVCMPGGDDNTVFVR
jgi:formylglycine-generating enzyme required for sulfatase activity